MIRCRYHTLQVSADTAASTGGECWQCPKSITAAGLPSKLCRTSLHKLLLLTVGDPLPADKRRKWCDIPKNLAGKQFVPDHVYTFHIWQHLIDFSTYSLSVGGFVNLDLTHALNCQPLQLTCKDTHSNEYMFSMLVWHERLLYGSDTSAAAALAERLSKWGAGFRSLLGGSKKQSG